MCLLSGDEYCKTIVSASLKLPRCPAHVVLLNMLLFETCLEQINDDDDDDDDERLRYFSDFGLRIC